VRTRIPSLSSDARRKVSATLDVTLVTSENGRRPIGVVTYAQIYEADMRRKLKYLLVNIQRDQFSTPPVEPTHDNVALTIDWPLWESRDSSKKRQANDPT